ncbi:MAG: hypothetical protein R6X22_00700 [Gemmatimonadota bacterium]
MRDEPDGTSRKGPSGPAEPSETELRAKYLEYCSARISEVFLSLSDERTYQLLEEAARDAGVDLGSLGFQSKMRLVTRKLRASVPLPDFADWVTEYRAHPDRFEPLLIGLWKEAVEDGRADPGSEEP